MAYHTNLAYVIIVMICQSISIWIKTIIFFDKIENSTVCIYEDNQNGDKSHFPQGSHGFTTVHKHYDDNNVLRPTYYERGLVRLVLMVFCYL